MTDYISNRPWEKTEVELSQEDTKIGYLIFEYYAISSNEFVDNSVRFPNHELELKRYKK